MGMHLGTDFKEQYYIYSEIRNAFVCDFIFLKSEGYFANFIVEENLTSLGMGYNIYIITDRLVISLIVSKLERCSSFTICKKESNVDPVWSVVRSEFNPEEFFGFPFQELSSDFDDIKKYLKEASMRLSNMIEQIGIDGVMEKLE